MQAYIVRYSIDEQGTLKLGIKVKFGECSAEERAALATAKADGTEITMNIQDIPNA